MEKNKIAWHIQQRGGWNQNLSLFLSVYIYSEYKLKSYACDKSHLTQSSIIYGNCIQTLRDKITTSLYLSTISLSLNYVKGRKEGHRRYYAIEICYKYTIISCRSDGRLKVRMRFNIFLL